jgi:hypothetical protein
MATAGSEDPSLAVKADRAATRTHFLPQFGSRAIADLATDEGEVALLDAAVGAGVQRRGGASGDARRAVLAAGSP